MKKELKSNITQQLIIDEAFKLFYKGGYKSTSVDKIMKATNLTKGAFYHHYKTKKQLGQAVIRIKLKERVHANMITPLHSNLNAITILEDVFLNKIKNFTEFDKKHGCALNNLINEIGDQDITHQNELRQIIETWKTELIQFIEKGKLDNSIQNNADAKAVATFLISAFEGIRGIRKLYTNDNIINDYINGVASYLEHLKFK